MRPGAVQPQIPDWIQLDPGGASGRRRPRRRTGSRLRQALLVALGFWTSGLAGAGAYFMPALAAAARDTGQRVTLPAGVAQAAQAGPTPSQLAGIAPFTVLLLGSDDDQKFDPNHILTQSMILLRVDPGAHQVTMLSIPRDLWVPLASGGTAKIDLAYAGGGPPAAIATVEQNFHVRIDDYVWIGLKGLIKLIDLVGGVDVITSNPVMDDFYPNDIDSNNPYGYQRVAVLPGPQHLDGVHALQYVRSRHSDLRGDFGRSARQQQVLLSLRSKAHNLTPADIPDLVGAFNGEFKTSIGFDRAGDLLPLAAQLKNQDVRQLVLFGDGYTAEAVVQDQDVLIPDWAAILPLVHQYFPAG